MPGRSLELFFIDGEPDGLLTAEVFNWTGHVLSTPRTQLAKALKRPEARHTGVYVLLGERDGEDVAYIGEGENVADRIKSHDTKKDWWERAVLVTTTGNALNKAHVQYLEARLLEKARRAKRVILDNAAAPSVPGINEAAQSNMESFLDQLFVVFPAIRVDVFSEQTRESKPARELEDAVRFQLELKKENIRATAILEGSEFVVQAGSLARFDWIGDRKHQTPYWKLHDNLVEQGVLESHGTVRRFTSNYAFSSTSAAGAVVTGRSTAGPIAWKEVATGMTYKDWEASRLAGSEPK